MQSYLDKGIEVEKITAAAMDDAIAARHKELVSRHAEKGTSRIVEATCTLLHTFLQTGVCCRLGGTLHRDCASPVVHLNMGVLGKRDTVCLSK